MFFLDGKEMNISLYTCFFVLSYANYSFNAEKWDKLYDFELNRYEPNIPNERECRSFRECLISFESTIELLLMKDFKWRHIQCADGLTVISGSIRITLLSDLSWELFDDTSKLKSFSREERKEYRVFRNEWISRGELPYEMVDKIEVIEEILTEEKIKCLEVNYIIKPDSTGKLEITEREILYSAE